MQYCKTLNTCSIKFSCFTENDILAHFKSGVLIQCTMAPYSKEKFLLIFVNFLFTIHCAIYQNCIMEAILMGYHNV